MYKKLRLRYKNNKLQQRFKKEQKYFDFTPVKEATKAILVIDSIVPEYDKDSGSRRLYNIIKLMQKNGFTVLLMADKKEYKYKTDYVPNYQKMGVVVYEPSLNEDGTLLTREDFVRTVSKYIDFAWLHRPDIFHAYHEIVKAEKVPLIFDMVDFHYLRLTREWEKSGDAKIKKEADKYLAIEKNCCEQADKIIAISDMDKVALKAFYDDESKMITMGNIHQFIGGTDKTPLADRDGLLFVGGFGHKPNVDAVQFLHDEVMPKVWAKSKNIKVTIVGSYPTKEIEALNSEKFEVLGFVEDLTALFYNHRAFIAPLRFGAGIKGKIGQSLEYGLPVITTTVGAEGFDFAPYEDTAIADTAEEIANNILKVYEDDVLWKQMSDCAEKVLQPFSLSHIEENMLKALKQ